MTAWVRLSTATFTSNSVSGHAPSDAILVSDANLLFNGDFKRSGVDLVLSKDSQELVLHDYFKGEKRAALSSPDGAHLTGDIINALTGHQQFAQADGSASVAKVIGHVSKLVGTGTAIRNGVSIILNNGDNVEKGDVVQCGSGSTLGITFIDGTVFGLSSNARMVLNEMVYDPNGSNNSSLLSLVAGTISFVAGETAKHGDMKVDTPVATMGIRGTAVLVEIDFDVPGQGGAPAAKFQVLVEPDGTTGKYVLLDKLTQLPIATVDQAGVVKSISQGIIDSYSAPLSPDAQKLITDLFALKFSQAPDPNPKTTTAQNDTITPESMQPFKVTIDAVDPKQVAATAASKTATADTAGGPTDPNAHIPGAPTVVALGGGLIERIGVTHSSTTDVVSGTIIFADLNKGDRPTVTTKFDSFTYQNAAHEDVTANLNAQQLADIAAVEAKLLMEPDSANTNTGFVRWTYSIVDSAFDFIAVGETLTLTYVARVDNNFAPNNETGFQTFSITITRGSNDVPVIVTGPQTVAFSGGTETPGGDLTPSGPTSGTLAFNDVDLTDTHTVSTKLATAVLSGSSTIAPGPLAFFETAVAASIAADSTGTGHGTIHWTLADLPVYLADFIPEGETLTLTYTVTVTDSQNATGIQNIIVTITGTNAPAVVWIATSSDTGGKWDDAANWETGTVPTANDDVIIITDQLRGLTPSFPVTIDAPAFAKSLTMNDFGSSDPESSPPVPELINQSTLTISGVLSLGEDSIVHNSQAATISVGGLMEVSDTSVVDNAGLITLALGGDFKDDSSITNTITGTIAVTGGTLNVQVDIANAGHVTVGSNAILTLNSGAIEGGTVTNSGEIDLAGSAALKDGSLSNAGQIKVSNAGNALHHETVTKNNILEILAGGALLLDLSTTFANAGGAVTVDGNALLSLDSASIDQGTVTNKAGGVIDLTGAAILKSGVLANSGHINVSDTGNELEHETVTNTSGLFNVTGELVLELGTTISGGILTNSGHVQIETIEGATLDGVTVNNAGGTVQIDTVSFDGKLVIDDGTAITGGTMSIGSLGILEVESVATLTDVTVENSGVVQVDADSVLNLDGTTITHGRVAGDGAIHVTGDSAIDGAKVDIRQITVDADDTLKLDDTTVTGTTITDLGTVKVDTDETLKLTDVALSGGGAVAVETNALVQTAGNVILAADVTNDGTIEIHDGVLKISGSVEGAGSVQIDGGARFELDGSDTQDIVFAGAGAELQLDASSFGGSISGLTATDELDLRSIGYGAKTTGTYVGNANHDGGVLTITDGIKSISLTLVGDYSHAHFAGGTDSAGGTLITLNANDDLPVFAAADKTQSGVVTELSHTTGSSVHDPLPSIGGSIHFSDIDLTDRPAATITAQSVTWTAADQTDLSWSLTPDELAALEHALSLVQTGNTNSGAIDWTYSITDSALDFIAAGQTVKVTSTVTLDDHEGGTDTATVTVFIGGSNDAPVLAADTSGVSGTGLHVIAERAYTTGDTADLDSVSGTLAFTDTDLSDTHSVSHGAPSYLWSGGALTTAQTDALTAAATLALSKTDSTHTGAGSIGFTYSAADSNFDFVAAGETLTVCYDVTVTDDHGASSTQPVTVTITGADDKPVITSGAQTGSTSEIAGTRDSSSEDHAYGTVTFTDVDLSDTHTVSVTGVTASGAKTGLPSDSDTLKSWLHLGVLTDSSGGVTGCDDWTFSAQDKNFDYLAAGETVKLTYTVQVDDHHGGTTTQNVDVTVTGTNDAPVITSSAQTGSITERAGLTDSDLTDTAHGTVTFTDADLSDTHTVTVTGVTASGVMTGLPSNATLKSWLSLGPLTDSSGGATGSDAWTFSAQDENFDYLAAGQTVKLTYAVQVADHHGGTTTQNVDITITGTNDAPVILSETNPLKQTVIAVSPVTPIVLAQGVNNNALGLNTESFDDQSRGSASDNGDDYGTFHSAALGATFTESGHAGVVRGSSSVSAAPFVGPGQADATNYLSIGGGGTETITFAHEQNAFGLYWGSVNSYNTIAFYHGTTLVASYSGADISPLFPTGSQGSFSSNGYVEFLGLGEFDKVVLASSSNAFEIDNISAGSVPAPHVQLAAPVTGTMNVSDADIGDTLTASVIGDAVIKYNNSTSLPGSADVAALKAASAVTFDSVQTTGGVNVLHWTYDPNNPDLDFLKAGDTLTVTYTARVNDGHGNVGSQALTITIAGADHSADMSNFKVVSGTSQNDTFNNVGNNVTIFGAGGHDTFVFNAHFGSATIGDFDVNNDAINIDHSLFATVSAFVQHAQSSPSGLDTIITDAANDVLTLKGVNLTQFTTHQSDFHIV